MRKDICDLKKKVAEIHGCLHKTRDYAQETSRNTNVLALELNSHIARTRIFQKKVATTQSVMLGVVIAGIFILGIVLHQVTTFGEMLTTVVRGML